MDWEVANDAVLCDTQSAMVDSVWQARVTRDAKLIRRMGLASLGLALGCGPSVVPVLLPPVSPAARTAVISVSSERSRQVQAVDLRDDGPTRLESDGEFVLHVLVYPHAPEVLRTGTGEISDESGQLIPRPMRTWQYASATEGWQAIDELPRGLAELRVRLTPTEPIEGRVRRVESGTDFSCALERDARVSCWGLNSQGQLGRMSPPVISATPLVVEGVLGVRALGVGARFACALLETRKVSCWGASALGRGADHDGTVARTVTDLADAISLAVGASHACVLLASGEVECWGSNASGAVGLPQDTDILEPHVVSGIDSVVQLVAGYEHTCALRFDGSVWCWGFATFVSAREPTEIIALGPATAIAGGSGHLCAQRSDGSVWCVGNNSVGQIAADGPELAEKPLESDLSGKPGTLEARGPLTCIQGASRVCAGVSVNIPLEADPVRDPRFLSRVRSLAVGFGSHACATLLDGSVECWGHSTSGQLGVEPPTHRLPVEVPGIDDASRVVAGPLQTCVFRRSGAPWCFGQNSSGTLSKARTIAEPIPIPHWFATDHLALTDFHACARTSTPPGVLACWGANPSGQLGRAVPDTSPDPLEVPGTQGVIDAAISARASCVVVSGGRVLCWGSNAYGQLGVDPDLDPAARPPADTGLSDFGGVSIGTSHVCGFTRSDGEIFCWGSNVDHQLGISELGPSPTPKSTRVKGAVQIDSGSGHTCVRMSDHRVRCFGRNDSGQLGEGSRADRGTPTEVPEIDDALDLATGEDHTCVVRAGGQVSCFGSNSRGQLGNGSRELDSVVPTAVSMVDDGVSVAAGRDHTCVVRSSGRVVCFGTDSWGQLGIGTEVIIGTPRRISRFEP
ncbi:MAG: hypothetical protein HY791_33735 [Deltaproteobacteria bacterium]|nr:hypothetical protein [Deltaproteobacteria bacterium]